MARASIPSTSRVNLTRSCILFHFYIKPQLLSDCPQSADGCILFHFYIKPQLYQVGRVFFWRCILFHFYIKPQHCVDYPVCMLVVSYSISTSNHNFPGQRINPGTVVSYSISTSNHNSHAERLLRMQLYLIPFLHQTTTPSNIHTGDTPLYLIPFLHQTTTLNTSFIHPYSCILFHFYIKPQRRMNCV